MFSGIVCVSTKFSWIKFFPEFLLKHLGLACKNATGSFDKKAQKSASFQKKKKKISPIFGISKSSATLLLGTLHVNY